MCSRRHDATVAVVFRSKSVLENASGTARADPESIVVFFRFAGRRVLSVTLLSRARENPLGEFSETVFYFLCTPDAVLKAERKLPYIMIRTRMRDNSYFINEKL